jgi:hypothetical protein
MSGGCHRGREVWRTGHLCEPVERDAMHENTSARQPGAQDPAALSGGDRGAPAGTGVVGLAARAPARGTPGFSCAVVEAFLDRYEGAPGRLQASAVA